MPSISLLIPAYNEEKSIEEVLESHLELLLELQSQKMLDDFEILILDDGSNDLTNSRASKIAKKSKKISLITNAKPSGLQGAFEQLYKCAHFDWTLLTPGDGQWPAKGVDIMIRAAKEHDWERGVIGIRTKKFRTYTTYRFILSFLFRVYSYLILKEDLIDPGSIKLLPSYLNKYEYRTSSPLQEIERIKLFRLKNSEDLVYAEVPWVIRSSGKANGASVQTLLKVATDFLILFKRQ